jgi:hypothetical protein
MPVRQSRTESEWANADVYTSSSQISRRPWENNSTNASSVGAMCFGMERRQPELDVRLNVVWISLPSRAASSAPSNTVGGASGISGPSTMRDLISCSSPFSMTSESDRSRNRPGCNINSQTARLFSFSESQWIRLQYRGGIVIRPASGLAVWGANPASSIVSHRIMKCLPIVSKRYLDITQYFPYDLQQSGRKMFGIPWVVYRWTAAAMCAKLPEREPSPEASICQFVE